MCNNLRQNAWGQHQEILTATSSTRTGIGYDLPQGDLLPGSFSLLRGRVRRSWWWTAGADGPWWLASRPVWETLISGGHHQHRLHMHHLQWGRKPRVVVGGGRTQWLITLNHGAFTLPNTVTDGHQDIDTDKQAQKPTKICDGACLCAVWTPRHNSIYPIFYQSLYRSWCRAVWTYREI